MVHNNNGVPYRANVLMYLKSITTRYYNVCCRDGDYRINSDDTKESSREDLVAIDRLCTFLT